MKPLFTAKHYWLGILSGLALYSFGTYLLWKQLIPPHYSANLSFNRKARFLANKIESCDIVVIGSSMAVNNIHGEEFARMTGRSVLNFGFWGASITDDLTLFNELMRYCHPKLVILPLYTGDISETWDQQLPIRDMLKFAEHKDFFSQSLWHSRTLLQSLIHEFIVLRGPRYTEATQYEYLRYDSTGSLKLKCGDFDISDSRWNFIKPAQSNRSARTQEQLEALSLLLAATRTRSIPTLIIRTPLRSIFDSSDRQAPDAETWDRIHVLAQQNSAELISVSNSPSEGNAPPFPDSDFVDYSHLNECGSRKLAQTVLQRSKSF